MLKFALTPARPNIELDVPEPDSFPKLSVRLLGVRLPGQVRRIVGRFVRVGQIIPGNIVESAQHRRSLRDPRHAVLFVGVVGPELPEEPRGTVVHRRRAIRAVCHRTYQCR